MKKKNGFVFIETIIVTCVLLASLMVIYALYVNSINAEARKLRYDDPAKLYQTYYVKKYLESFDLQLLKNKIKNGAKYEMIYRSRSDIFGVSYTKESLFIEELWMKLAIKNIYLFPYNIAELAKCNSYSVDDKVFKDAICTNTNLITYLRNIDDVEEGDFVLVIEYATARDGSSCLNSNCFYYYSYITVGG